MKILFFVSSLNAGGAERVAVTLANAWAARGDEVILVPTFRKRQASFYPLHPKVKLNWLGGRWIGPAKWWRIRRLVRKHRPHIALSFLTNVNVNVLLATVGMRLPVIVSERSHPSRHVGARYLLSLLRRLCYPRAWAVIAQTNEAQQALHQLIPRLGATWVVPNPLPPEFPFFVHGDRAHVHIASHGESRPYIAAMGRLVASKQFDVLIDCFAQLAVDFAQWDLYIWGDGPLRSALQEQIRLLGLEGRVFLPGRTTQPWQVLSRAQIFAMTSRLEGFPNVMLEAMGLGVPSVVIDCPSGPAEISRQGQDAILIKQNDQAGLVGALRILMDDPQERAQWGERAALAVRSRYALPSILALWDDIFAAACAGRRGGNG